MLGQTGLDGTKAKAEECGALVDSGKWTDATACWSQMESYVGEVQSQALAKQTNKQ